MEVCKYKFFPLPKQSKRSSFLQDGSRFLGLFWKEKQVSNNQRNRVAKGTDGPVFIDVQNDQGKDCC